MPSQDLKTRARCTINAVETKRRSRVGVESGEEGGGGEHQGEEEHSRKRYKDPWPIYHKLRGLWRESSRILPEEARETVASVSR